MKWDAIEATRGIRTFAAADDLVAFASVHGMSVRGHTLLWDRSTPRWAKTALVQDRRWSLIDQHLSAVVGRYRSSVKQWDVVNEPIDTEQGSGGLRANTFFKAFGPDYIGRALALAHQLAPEAGLMVNDYGFDYENPVDDARRRAFLSLLERLVAAKAPLHGVGLQAHLDLSKGAIPQRTLETFLQRIADLGLEIGVTELDVKEHTLTGSLAERDQRVAAEVDAYLQVAMAQPAVKGVTTWGLSDRHSWLQDDRIRVPASAERTDTAHLNRGLPYDAELGRKPMYWVMAKKLAWRSMT